jgi:signal transduction histidine kinase
LTAINLHLAALKMEAAGSTRDLRKNITNAQKLLKKSVQVVHRFSYELRPTLLDDLGIIPALQAHIKDFTQRTNIPIRFQSAVAVEKLNNVRRTALYRIAQEALVNVVQHAQASRVIVSLRKIQDAVVMKITDNGRSFPVERVLAAQKSGSLGLLGMRERIEMVGGIFNILSVRGKGTTIQAQVPLK